MKTIAFCNSTLAWGGGENWHLEAALFMAEQGYAVIMLAHERGVLYERAKQHERAGFTVEPLSIGRLSFLNPLTICRYARFLKEKDVDTVIMNLPQDLKCMGLAAQKARISRIIYRRGSALPVRNSVLNRYLYGRVLTGLIVNSEATKREVFRHNKSLIQENRVLVIPNGIDIASFDERLAAADMLPGILPCPTPSGAPVTENKEQNGGLDTGEKAEQPKALDKPQILGKSQVLENSQILGKSQTLENPQQFENTGETAREQDKKKPIILGNAGRLNRQKGQQYLLYLARALESLGVEYRLVIAGSGERREELETLARDLGVAEKVFFCGFLADTAPFWRTIDVFVLTSLWEGFGYVLLEAMLSAKPILAFEVSNIPELVEDGKNGFLFPLPQEQPSVTRTAGGEARGADAGAIPDMGAMAEAVRRLAENADLRHSMGEAGRAFASPAFDQKVVMKKLLSALESGPLAGNGAEF